MYIFLFFFSNLDLPSDTIPTSLHTMSSGIKDGQTAWSVVVIRLYIGSSSSYYDFSHLFHRPLLLEVPQSMIRCTAKLNLRPPRRLASLLRRAAQPHADKEAHPL